MGMFRDLAAAGVGYGIRTLQDKHKENKVSENDILCKFMFTHSLEDVLDKYREANEIRINTDAYERFINDLAYEVEKGKRKLI